MIQRMPPKPSELRSTAAALTQHPMRQTCDAVCRMQPGMMVFVFINMQWSRMMCSRVRRRQISENFAWLQPRRIRDAQGRQSSHAVRQLLHFLLVLRSSMLWSCNISTHQPCCVSHAVAVAGCQPADAPSSCLQDYDPRTVQVPEQIFGKLSGVDHCRPVSAVS